MQYDFSLPLPHNWEEKWPLAEEVAGDYGFSVKRTGNIIEVEGLISGIITTDDGTGYVKITKKPFFVSNAMIEDKIREYLAKVA